METHYTKRGDQAPQHCVPRSRAVRGKGAAGQPSTLLCPRLPKGVAGEGHGSGWRWGAAWPQDVKPHPTQSSRRPRGHLSWAEEVQKGEPALFSALPTWSASVASRWRGCQKVACKESALHHPCPSPLKSGCLGGGSTASGLRQRGAQVRAPLVFTLGMSLTATSLSLHTCTAELCRAS